MIDRKDEEMLLNGFSEYLKNKGLAEKSVNDDLSRIVMMISHDIDYTKGEEYSRDLLRNHGFVNSSIVSCLRVCRYYTQYLEMSND